jgi:hypothetical protein
MRICFWKDGGSENESNQVVILAINLRLRNRWVGAGPCQVTRFQAAVAAAGAPGKEGHRHPLYIIVFVFSGQKNTGY